MVCLPLMRLHHSLFCWKLCYPMRFRLKGVQWYDAPALLPSQEHSWHYTVVQMPPSFPPQQSRDFCKLNFLQEPKNWILTTRLSALCLQVSFWLKEDKYFMYSFSFFPDQSLSFNLKTKVLFFWPQAQGKTSACVTVSLQPLLRFLYFRIDHLCKSCILYSSPM